MSRVTSLPFSIVTGRTVFRIIESDYNGCVETVSAAYIAHAEGRSCNPPSTFVRFQDRPNSRIIALPAHLAAPWNLSGIKWIASFPDNISHGFPRASAVLVLNSHENGYPFALLEAATISAARTAASATLAAHYLSDPRHRARALGLVGNGLIARYVYRFLLGTGWEINELHLYDNVPDRAEQFRDRVSEPARHAAVHVAPDLESLLMTCDLIVFATVVTRPHIRDARLFQHKPLILHLSLRDIAPEVLLGACNVVDDTDHVMHADTSPHLAEQLTGDRDFITGTLAEVINGQCVVDRSKPVVFSPFGLGVLDIAVGKWVYDRAVAAGENLTIDEFFYDEER